jgi:maltose alpha-D-glucosyltransferase/alpha-amylase
VANQGDAWNVVTDALHRDLEEYQLLRDGHDATTGGTGEEFGVSLMIGRLLGQRTGELHKAFATDSDNPDFGVEPITRADVRAWSDEAVAETEAMLKSLSQAGVHLPDGARAIAEEVLAQREQLIARLKAAPRMKPSGGRTRIHGDYHLGQVLVAQDDVMIIDFEGEPRRSLEERRAKSSPLRDVAGMLRSFHYAASTALNRRRAATGTTTADDIARAARWRNTVSADFISAYMEHAAGSPANPDDQAFADALLDLFLIQKAVYEVGYELANRPDWVDIPLAGVRDLLGDKKAEP